MPGNPLPQIHVPLAAGGQSSIAPVRVHGKWLQAGDQRYTVRGVTYGPFRCDNAEGGFPDGRVVARDFAAMRDAGLNSLRTYTIPPRWLLDLALAHGLRVMVGIPWEEHIAFLGSSRTTRRIERTVRAAIREHAGHPAVMAWVIGNEIPAGIVRWHGARAIERFIERLYLVAKQEAPDTPCTYVNYPTTEHLDLPFLDFVCFNVFLQDRESYEAYLARLQNIAGERPLVITEVGLDSRRNTERGQAEALWWQVDSTLVAGCAGLFVFSWTDEWYRGGVDIDDWDFGLVRRDRSPKPALAAVRDAFAAVDEHVWPRMSVVICTYNGARTLRECLEGATQLDYPDFEVIVVIDGSTDNSLKIANEFPFRVVHCAQNRGLSHVRNVGMHAATGEIVAYLDDDAYPDPLWLRRLAIAFERSGHAGIGGPNLPPPGDGLLAECVANSPGNPLHVLLTDELAEHIPGCNMAFRRSCLLAINGFDVTYRRAGDDVDLCWRIQDRGWTIGFDPAAFVWHHRRGSIKAFWRQQCGYGEAEAMLALKWPSRHNDKGHASWSGRVYGRGQRWVFAPRPLVYGGTWGAALFPKVYQPMPGTLAVWLCTPEWHLVLLWLLGLAVLGLSWSPMFVFAPLFVAAAGASVAQAVKGSLRACGPRLPGSSRWRWAASVAITAYLHLMQPVARLYGRLRYRSAARRQDSPPFAMPLPRSVVVWFESWRSSEQHLMELRSLLSRAGHVVRVGGGFDAWDLQLAWGRGCSRLLMAIEEHGQGRQLVRYRMWPKVGAVWILLLVGLPGIAIGAYSAGAWLAATASAAAAVVIAMRLLVESAAACSTLSYALRQLQAAPSPAVAQPAVVGTEEVVPFSVREDTEGAGAA
ncbi:MAG TPA: glycosyltransferase [Planctomycetota bacterium]|nr:glycosyltransferase [Planctomycetota bacterium]